MSVDLKYSFQPFRRCISASAIAETLASRKAGKPPTDGASVIVSQEPGALQYPAQAFEATTEDHFHYHVSYTDVTPM